MSDDTKPSTQPIDEETPIKYLSSNRRTGKDLAALADELNVSPFEFLLRVTAGDWRWLGYSSGTDVKVSGSGEKYEVELIPLELRFAAAKEAAQYLHPKKRAIEHSGSDDLPSIKFEGNFVDLAKLARG